MLSFSEICPPDFKFAKNNHRFRAKLYLENLEKTALCISFPTAVFVQEEGFYLALFSSETITEGFRSFIVWGAILKPPFSVSRLFWRGSQRKQNFLSGQGWGSDRPEAPFGCCLWKIRTHVDQQTTHF